MNTARNCSRAGRPRASCALGSASTHLLSGLALLCVAALAGVVGLSLARMVLGGAS